MHVHRLGLAGEHGARGDAVGSGVDGGDGRFLLWLWVSHFFEGSLQEGRLPRVIKQGGKLGLRRRSHDMFDDCQQGTRHQNGPPGSCHWRHTREWHWGALPCNPTTGCMLPVLPLFLWSDPWQLRSGPWSMSSRQRGHNTGMCRPRSSPILSVRARVGAWCPRQSVAALHRT